MRAAAFCALLCVLTGIASAQTPAQPLPFDRLSTQAIGTTLPAHWKTASLTIDHFLVEQGLLIPETNAAWSWRDQIGYVAVPSSAGSVGAVRAADATEQTCARSVRLNIAPRAAQAGDDWVELICLVGIAAPDAIPQAPLEIIVFNSRLVGDGGFVFWRGWRGTLAEAAPMFARHHQTVAAVPANPSSADFAVWRAAMPSLIEDFATEMRNAVTICDLAGRPCVALHHPAGHTNAIALITIAGASAQPADRDFPVAALDFTSPQTASDIIAALTAAQTGGGGTITFSGTADPEQSARIRAYALRIGRASAQQAVPPDALSFDLWPGVR